MTAKEQAILDIQEELTKQGKAFIAFRTELNPIMDALVKEQLEESRLFYDPLLKAKSQLVATCMFCKETGKSKLVNYSKYYAKENI